MSIVARTFGILLVRDEADVIEHTITAMLGEVDHIIALDNGSVDGTREILERLGVEVVPDFERAHYQSRKVSFLARRAAAQGAEWVVPFDADERWYSPFGRVGDVLADLPATVAVAAIYNHLPTDLDPDDPNPLARMGWRGRDPLPLHKVACRVALPVTIAEGNHGAHYPPTTVEHGQLVVRHFPYRSPEQFVRKARNGSEALAATNLPEDVGRHWRDYGRLLDAHGPEALHEVFRDHFSSADPENDPSLIFDPAP